MRRMLKIGSFVLLIIILLTSCNNFHIENWILGERDFYAGRRPTDFPLSKWISDSPNIWFEVPEIEENAPPPDPLYGKAEFAGETIDIQFFFDRGITMRGYKVDSNDQFVLLFEGSCYFEKEKVTVTIDKETDILFEGKYDEIIFVKKNVSSQENY